MLEGVVKRGTGKKLNKLKLDIAGKTGTTNKNTHTWFIGFTSKLVVGVYVGLDEPKSLGKRETGSKTAMPVFKEFITEAIEKKDTRPFKVADNITMMVIDKLTGQKANFASKETIVEVFKKNPEAKYGKSYSKLLQKLEDEARNESLNSLSTEASLISYKLFSPLML